MHVQELQRLGADIAVDGKTADREGRAGALRRAGDGLRPARLGGARPRRARGAAGRPRSTASTTSTAATSGSSRSSRRSARASGGRRPDPRARRAGAALGANGASMPNEIITVAVPKGRLLEESSALFERALGVSPKALLDGTRKLAADAPEVGLRFISIRAADVASYVEHGAAAVGHRRPRRAARGPGGPVRAARPRDRALPRHRGAPARGEAAAAGRRAAGRHEVRVARRPALRPEGRPRGDHPPARLHRGRPLARPRRRHRGHHRDRRDARGERARRSRRRSSTSRPAWS